MDLIIMLPKLGNSSSLHLHFMFSNRYYASNHFLGCQCAFDKNKVIHQNNLTVGSSSQRADGLLRNLIHTSSGAEQYNTILTFPHPAEYLHRVLMIQFTQHHRPPFSLSLSHIWVRGGKSGDSTIFEGSFAGEICLHGSQKKSSFAEFTIAMHYR